MIRDMIVVDGWTDQLTPMELAVLRCLAGGLNQHNAGRVLGLAVGTVKSHTLNARRKLRARNTTHAVALCYERGIFDGRPPTGLGIALAREVTG